MLIAFFLNSVFSQPVKPHGWERRTDAKPYLEPASNGQPRLADPGLKTAPGWELHVRVKPNGGDDWRAKLAVTSVPISFRAHIRDWPSDEWVYYQLLGRITVVGGAYKFGVNFATADNGIGCFVDFRVGGISVVQADTVKFFSLRAPKTSDRDEISLTGDITLQPGDYDAVATLGCHPGKMGQPIKRRRLESWESSQFAFVIQPPGETLRLMRGSEVVHVQ